MNRSSFEAKLEEIEENPLFTLSSIYAWKAACHLAEAGIFTSSDLSQAKHALTIAYDKDSCSYIDLLDPMHPREDVVALNQRQFFTNAKINHAANLYLNHEATKKTNKRFQSGKIPQVTATLAAYGTDVKSLIVNVNISVITGKNQAWWNEVFGGTSIGIHTSSGLRIVVNGSLDYLDYHIQDAAITTPIATGLHNQIGYSLQQALMGMIRGSLPMIPTKLTNAVNQAFYSVDTRTIGRTLTGDPELAFEALKELYTDLDLALIMFCNPRSGNRVGLVSQEKFVSLFNN